MQSVLPLASASAANFRPARRSTHALLNNKCGRQCHDARTDSLICTVLAQNAAVHKARLQPISAAAPVAPPLETAEAPAETLHQNGSSPSHATAASSSRESQTAKFQWLTAWYPVFDVDSLDPAKPHAVQLLGKRLVVWRDASETWQCFEDLCPHRLAPLSEGRLETDGTLTCAYHGWRFDGSGQCTYIPQINEDRAQNNACSNQRSCVKSFPTQVKNKLLWVWPGDPKTATSTPTCAPEDHNVPDDSLLWFAHWFVRDVPYSAETLNENVLDPSHVQFSHHKVIGHRSLNTKYDMEVLSKPEASTGFQVQQNTTQLTDKKGKEVKDAATKTATLNFRPPCRALVNFSTGLSMITYSVPTAPGQARLFFALTRPAEGAPKMMKLALKVFGHPWLRWRAHLNQNEVLDGDNVFLHMQDNTLAQQEGPALQRYFIPAQADVAVRCVRQWFSSHAEALPWAAGSSRLPPSASREQLLDRFNSHTTQCPSCMMAFKLSAWVMAAGAASALLATVFATASFAAGNWHAARLVACAAVSAAGAWAAVWAQQLRQKLVFKDYVHAEHH
ncbi:hypothetical protein WJX73_007911 [Symbiochloris irregularis]|uniref:Rieske domain-containing protein n=1 Tax=Symbiochloris irregularis TaxID=706552 RepID=A0AAW1NRW1_9CHLO